MGALIEILIEAGTWLLMVIGWILVLQMSANSELLVRKKSKHE